MPEAKSGRGRPRKYQTEEDARQARNAASRASRRRKNAQQQEQPGIGGLRIEFDPRSILQQVGVEGDAQITAPDRGIQADGLSVPVDEERLQLLEVAV